MDASACGRPGIPTSILDPLASYLTRAFASVCPDLGLWESVTVLNYKLSTYSTSITLSAIYAWKHYPTNCAFLSSTVTLLRETTSTADYNVDASIYCLLEEKNSEKTQG